MTTATATATGTATTEPRFLARFDRIWEALRRYQVREGLCWTLLATALALGALALADYWFELPQTARGIGLDVVGVFALVVLWYAVVVPLRWWSRPRTAAEIEARFPELGQRIRTVVQYASLPDERIHSEGVAPSLVAALSEETQIRAVGLPLDVIIPRRRAWAVAALAVIPVLAMLAPALVNPEWQTTLARLLLIDQPYTTIAVAPGDVTVEQGDNLPIAVELKGRKRSQVVLETRPAEASKEPWSSRPLAPSASGPGTKRTATLEKVLKPLVYRVVAGPSASRTSRITVRYPLALTTFKVTLTPPAYTGLPQETVRGGDLRAVAGTEATFKMVFTALPREASLVVSESKASPKSQEGSAPPPAPQVIPLVPDGNALTARLSITHDADYAIVARTDDGRKLPKNGYHIDARADYPPRVGFDEPAEALEVHPIAEVLNRIRVADDFGLSKAGIVYRVNDGEEKTLVARDFTAPPAKPQTASKLEEMLALETLALTPTDSVTYYAFAEDNFPGGSRRVETDLRYIDIRPFKRFYRLADEGGGDGDPDEVTLLGELIARQRFNLNRTVRLAKQRPGDRTTPEDPIKIASFEELLAALTREVREGFQGAAGDQFESLQQAEAAMVAAVDALDREKPADASALEAEALRHLIEARRTLRFIVANGDMTQAMMQKLRAFGRIQGQKIRKPKTEAGEAEAAEALVAEIEELAGDEDFVYVTIAQIMEGSGQVPVETPPVQEPEPAEGQPTEDAPEAQTGQGQTGQAQAGQTGQEGQETAKEGDPKQTGPMDARGKSGTGKAAGTGKQPLNKKGDDRSGQPATKGAGRQAGAPKGNDQPGPEGQDEARKGGSPQKGRMAGRGEPDTRKTGGELNKNQGEDPSGQPAPRGAGRQAGTQKGNNQPGPEGEDEAGKEGLPKKGRMAGRGEPDTRKTGGESNKNQGEDPSGQPAPKRAGRRAGTQKENDQPGPEGQDESGKGGIPKKGQMAGRGEPDTRKTGGESNKNQGEDPSGKPAPKGAGRQAGTQKENDQPGPEGQDEAGKGGIPKKGQMAGRGEPETRKTGGESNKDQGEDPSGKPAPKGAGRQAGTQKGKDQPGPEGQDESGKGGSPKKGQMADRGEPETRKTGGESNKNQGEDPSGKPAPKGAGRQAGTQKGNDQPGSEGKDEARKGGSPKKGRMADRGDQGKEKTPGAGDEPDGNDRADASGTPRRNGPARGAKADAAGPGEAGKSKPMDRGAITAEQGRISDDARDLEERLKRLEAASELSKLRMAKAAEAAGRASGALERGQSKEAAGLTRNGAMLLHEVARQVKGEIAREPADAVAMARDRAEELAQREAEFAETPPTPSASDAESRGSESARGEKGGKAGARGKETDAEMLERLAEEARTLEQWLKQLAGRGEGKAGETARELLDQGKMTEIIRQIDRVAEMQQAGKSADARAEAAKVAQALEALARSLDMLHRDIVAPRLAELVEAEKRLAEQTERLDSLKTDAEVDAWQGQTMTLVRELEKKDAMTEVVAELEKAMVDAAWRAPGSTWTNTPNGYWRAPVTYTDALKKVARRIQDQIQEMILKDMMSSRDETTPPEFKELVERYYEVLSREGGGDSKRPR